MKPVRDESIFNLAIDGAKIIYDDFGEPLRPGRQLGGGDGTRHARLYLGLVLPRIQGYRRLV